MNNLQKISDDKKFFDAKILEKHDVLLWNKYISLDNRKIKTLNFNSNLKVKYIN